MKTLISWIAVNNDFKENRVDIINSPNYNMHKKFWDFDRHIILSSVKGDDTKASFLENQLNTDFPDHEVEIKYMNVPDVIDLSEIKTKVETLLLSYREDAITIFFSPGTSIMQVTWYICHSSLGLNTRLVQLRPAAKSRSKEPELLEIQTETSSIPVTSIIKELLVGAKEGTNFMTGEILLTKTLIPVYEKAEKIAQTDKVTVLIMGETGTGKEHLANYIHEKSNRRGKSFRASNCSALNDDLLAAQLFGYKQGAFTGAYKDTKGLFEEADGGTIFLDEIGDISAKMQQTLLRVLQQKVIEPLMGKPKKVDVRIIAATNNNLPELCKEGRFRWDLYYRLAIAEIELPSLIERGSKEIEEMFDFFLVKKKQEMNKGSLLRLNPEVKQFLKNYTWPGNVRELENLIETLYVFCDKDVTIDDLPSRFRTTAKEKSLNWKDAEKEHIEYVLRLKKGNQRQAWLALGYKAINTLRKKIELYEINI